MILSICPSTNKVEVGIPTDFGQTGQDDEDGKGGVHSNVFPVPVGDVDADLAILTVS